MRLFNLQNTYINFNEVIFIRIRSDFQEGNWTGIEFFFNNNSLSFEVKSIDELNKMIREMNIFLGE